MRGMVGRIINALIVCGTFRVKEEKLAEARRDAVLSLTNLVKTLPIQPGDEREDCINQNMMKKIYNCFLEGLQDYSVTEKGDEGAWLRDVAVVGLLVSPPPDKSRPKVRKN